MAIARGPILVVAVRHRPFEIAILVSMLASTLISMVSGPSMALRAINNYLPGYIWIWYVGVTLGSGIALTSAFLKTPTCLLLERIGLFLLGMMFAGYSVVTLIIFGLNGFGTGLLLFMFAIASAFRVKQLTADINLLKGIGVFHPDEDGETK